MASKWNGCTVSVTCINRLGVYQGLVSDVNPETQTILLSKPFKNGIPCEDHQVALSAHIIEEIKIIENVSEPLKATVSKPVAKRAHRPVSENIAHFRPGPSLNNTPAKQFSKPPPNIESPRKALNDADTFQSALWGFEIIDFTFQPQLLRNLVMKAVGRHKCVTGFEIRLFIVIISLPMAKRSKMLDLESECNNPMEIDLVIVVAKGEALHDQSSVQEIDDLSKQKRHVKSGEVLRHAGIINSNKKNPRHKWTERDEACFGEPIKPHLMKEFDFEKNLALFNKQAVFDKINAQQRPDLVRQTDRSHRGYKTEDTPTRFRQILVPQTGPKEYITDEGMVVPSISASLRDQLFALAQDTEFTFARQAELIGRAVAEIAIPLLGGPHRLNPLNNQQKPLVVVMVGSHRPGALGVNAARQLASQGVDTIVFLSHPMFYDDNVDQELNLFRQTGHKITDTIHELPPSGVDLVVIALADERTQKVPRHVANWVSDSKSVLLAVDPPAHGTPGIPVKYSLVPCLPLAHSPDNGKLFLVNLTIPHKTLFLESGVNTRLKRSKKSAMKTLKMTALHRFNIRDTQLERNSIWLSSNYPVHNTATIDEINAWTCNTCKNSASCNTAHTSPRNNFCGLRGRKSTLLENTKPTKTPK
ncbi:enhancer of mRNA decapping [Homalodisca vitripennis]|nr:enhancer of mRNA decapping [Homalodisca vitripennis]